MVVTLTHRGYIKRLPARDLPRCSTAAAGASPRMMTARKTPSSTSRSSPTRTTTSCSSPTAAGSTSSRLRPARRADAGQGHAVVNLIEIEDGEESPADPPQRVYDEDFILLMATRRGEVKKTLLTEFRGPPQRQHRHGPRRGRQLIGRPAGGRRDQRPHRLERGQAIRFDDRRPPPASRTSGGVRGISLADGGEVVGVGDGWTTATSSSHLRAAASASARPDRVPLQGRGGQGVNDIKITDATGPVVASPQGHSPDRS